jgi:hypothetical protein
VGMMNRAGNCCRRLHWAVVALGLFVWICLPARISAQQYATTPADLPSKPVTDETRGFTMWEQFLGSDSSQGQFLVFDSSLGFDFNRHIGVDVGVPVYLIRPTTNFAIAGGPAPNNHSWDYNVGDPYGDLRLSFPNRLLNYDTVVTFSVPVVGTSAFSTGRLGVDWFNHFDKPIYRFTPYVNGDLTNGLLDTRLLSQPFRLYDSFKSLGLLADVEGGMTFKMARGLSVGGSYYQLLPAGPQKIYGGGASDFFLFPNGVPPSDASSLTHDRGYTAFVCLNHGVFYFQPAYVHSIKLNDDAATVTVGVDLWALLTGKH